MYEEFEREHFRVLQRAHAIFVEKSAVRGQLWLEFPPSDKIRELAERTLRLQEGYKLREHLRTNNAIDQHIADIEGILVEDALDAINYAAFLIKQIERGMRG